MITTVVIFNFFSFVAKATHKTIFTFNSCINKFMQAENDTSMFDIDSNGITGL